MKTMDFIEKILGPGKTTNYPHQDARRAQNYWPVLPYVCHTWTSKIFYRKGAGARKCLIGCKGTKIWIWLGSPPVEDHRLDLKDPGSIQKIKTIMRVE